MKPKTKKIYKIGQLVHFYGMLAVIRSVHWNESEVVSGAFAWSYVCDRGTEFNSPIERYMDIFESELGTIRGLDEEDVYIEAWYGHDEEACYHSLVRIWLELNGLDSKKSLDEIPAQALNERQREEKSLLADIFYVEKAKMILEKYGHLINEGEKIMSKDFWNRISRRYSFDTYVDYYRSIMWNMDISFFRSKEGISIIKNI